MDDRHQGRRPANVSEAELFDLLDRAGWFLTKRGWPDFFIEKEGRIACVEVKPSGGRELKREQSIVQQALAACGIPCFVWSPDGGLQQISHGGVGGPLGDTVRTLEELSLPLLDSTTQDEGGSGGNAQGTFLTRPLFDQQGRRDGVSQSEVSQAVDSIWETYVNCMKPRRKEISDEERVLIRKALRAASAEEVGKAILGCASSDFHMGKNPRGKKYNRLSQIIKGRRGKDTTRERIDFFLDLLEQSGGASSNVPSASSDLIETKKREVQRGHRFRGDQEAERRAKAAEEWLLEHGIKTIRKPDGYPTFKWEHEA